MEGFNIIYYSLGMISHLKEATELGELANYIATLIYTQGNMKGLQGNITHTTHL